MGGCVKSEKMERFGGGATLPSEVKLAKSKKLYIFEVVNKNNCIEIFSSFNMVIYAPLLK